MIFVILAFLAVLLAGMADGLNNAVGFHFFYVKKRLNLSKKFWDPTVSWMNKYKEVGGKLKPKFFGSTTFLVFITDGWHLTRFIEHLFWITSIVLFITFTPQLKGEVYVLGGLGVWFVNRIGFNITYSLGNE